MTPFEALERADALRERVAPRQRISMTELVRDKSWRDELAANGIVELTDRGETTAWMVSDDEMQALMKAYTLLEERVERSSLAAMIEARKDDHPVSGEELRQGALKAIDEHLAEWQGIADEHRK